jgi:hypothetical protein
VSAYGVVDTTDMAVSGPVWTMGGKIAAAGVGRDAADLPGGLASLQQGGANCPNVASEKNVLESVTK